MPERKTVGQLMEEMRLKAGAQNYHGHEYMDLERFAEDTRHMIKFIEHYTGLDDIPEEYCISHVQARDEKEETRSILETIKQFKEDPPVPHKDKTGPSHEER